MHLFASRTVHVVTRDTSSLLDMVAQCYPLHPARRTSLSTLKVLLYVESYEEDREGRDASLYVYVARFLRLPQIPLVVRSTTRSASEHQHRRSLASAYRTSPAAAAVYYFLTGE
jgi:hypothetical protein